MYAGSAGTQYRPLSEQQVETIHEAALTILENIGVTHEEGLSGTIDMLEKAGAKVDRTAARVRFPRELISEHVAKAPAEVIFYGRDKKYDLILGSNRVHMGTGGTALTILDLETGAARQTRLRDIFDIGRIVDRLDNIHFYMRPVVPWDIPPEAYDVNSFYACMRATPKHVMCGCNFLEGFEQVVKMAGMIAGGKEKLIERPFISTTACFAISPLKLCTDSTRIMQAAIRHRIPVALSSAPMAGSTAPMTMAGQLAQLHAEELCGITICQLTNPGAPLLYGGIPGAANLASMGYSGGAVECGMMNAAIHQLAHHVGVPNYNSAALSDAKLPDIQAGWEKGLTILLAAMGGSNYVHHAAGMLESMLAVAYEQYIIDDEIIGSAMKALQGITVDEQHLALEVIDQVGPGGNFITADHTMEHMRSEFFQGNGVADRKIRESWEEEGALDARERARRMAHAWLAEPEKSYIAEDIDRRIRETFEILL